MGLDGDNLAWIWQNISICKKCPFMASLTSHNPYLLLTTSMLCCWWRPVIGRWFQLMLKPRCVSNGALLRKNIYFIQIGCLMNLVSRHISIILIIGLYLLRLPLSWSWLWRDGQWPGNKFTNETKDSFFSVSFRWKDSFFCVWYTVYLSERWFSGSSNRDCDNE